MSVHEEDLSVPVIDDGLVMDNLEETTQDEIDAHLTRRWRNRGPLYAMSSISIMLDHRPDFAKLHRRGAAMFGRPSPTDELVGGLGNLHTYIHLGFEPGILNEVRNRQRQGVSRAQFLDLFMMAQLSAGIRGLQHIYNAVGILLSDFQDRPATPPFPEGWAPDSDAFKAGLDLSTPELTGRPRRHRSVVCRDDRRGTPLSHLRRQAPPRLLEGLPCEMGSRFPRRTAEANDALSHVAPQYEQRPQGRHPRVGASGQSVGLSKMWVIKAVTQSGYYFTGLEALSVADEALAPILENWE